MQTGGTRVTCKRVFWFTATAGTRLWRGYYEEAKMEDKPSDVTHLVFVVHGIGQKYNEKRIIQCCNKWVVKFIGGRNSCWKSYRGHDI